MNKDLIKETINFLMHKKEQFNEDIDEIIYKDLCGVPCEEYTFTSLTQKDINKLNTLRKKVFDVYDLVDKLENFKESNDEN